MLKKAKQTYDSSSSSSSNHNSPERSSQIVSPINTTNKRRNQSNHQNHNQNNNGLPKELNQVPLPNDLSILNTIQVSFYSCYSFKILCVFKRKKRKGN